MSYTPGPWLIQLPTEWELDLVRVGPGVALTDRPNAQLISMAPDMLEALERIKLLVENPHFIETIQGESGRRVFLRELNSVITKAKGELS